MSEELEQLLKNLKLRRMLEIYEEQLRAAEKQDVSYSEFLTRLLRAQWHHRPTSATGLLLDDVTAAAKVASNASRNEVRQERRDVEVPSLSVEEARKLAPLPVSGED